MHDNNLLLFIIYIAILITIPILNTINPTRYYHYYKW